MPLFSWRKRKDAQNKRDSRPTSGEGGVKSSSSPSSTSLSVAKGLGENGAAKKQVDLIQTSGATPTFVSSVDRSQGN